MAEIISAVSQNSIENSDLKQIEQLLRQYFSTLAPISPGGFSLGLFNGSAEIRDEIRKEMGEASRNLAALFHSSADPRLVESEQAHLVTVGHYSPLQLWAASVSHTGNIGGFLLIAKGASPDQLLEVGFDFEQERRVKPELVMRVSSAEELKSSPGAAILWSAKESSLKAMRSSLISDIRIKDWQNGLGEVSQFEAFDKNYQSKICRGFVFSRSQYVWSISWTVKS